MLLSGYHVLWMDPDVVLFADPRPSILKATPADTMAVQVTRNAVPIGWNLGPGVLAECRTWWPLRGAAKCGVWCLYRVLCEAWCACRV